MVDVTSVNIPAPVNWQDFEQLTLDLFACEWETNDAQPHGRTGQAQHGVDVFGTDRRTNERVGVQCKGKNADYGHSLKEKELRDEVEKAKKFTPAIKRFILVTTAPTDAKIQSVAREIDDKHRKSGCFEVMVMGWDELKRLIGHHPKVALAHFSGVSSLAGYQISNTLGEHYGAIEDRLSGIETIIRETSISSSAAPNVDPADDPLGQRITDAADLLNDSSAQTSISRLEKLLETEGRDASARNRFRIRANLGSAHFANGDKETAVKCFRQAYDEYSDTSEGVSILAAAESIAGNRKEAAKLAARAMAMPVPQQRAIGVFLETAPADVSWKDLQAQIPEKFRNTPEILTALAEHAQIGGQTKDCRSLVKNAVRRDENNWRVRAHAGYLRFQEIFDSEDIRSLRLMRKSDVEIVEDARTHFLSAWALLKNTGWVREAEICILNALSASMMLGDETKAEELIQEVFRLCGDTPQLLRFRAAQQMHKGEDREVIAILSKIPETDREPNDELMLIQAQINEGDQRLALARATDLYRTAETEDLRVAYGNCCMLSAAKIDLDSFQTIALDVLSDHPDATLLLANYVFNHSGDFEDPNIIDRLIDAAEGEGNSFALDRAAHALAKVGKNSEAADIYTRLCSPDIDTPQLGMALQTLINSRRVREARELYSAVDGRIKESAGMRRIGEVVFQCAGNLKNARKELEHIFGTDEETLEDRARWIDLCERLQDVTRVVKYLDTVPVDISGEARMRMHLAHKIDRLTNDHQKALEIGYRALRDGYDDPLIHVGYLVGLILTGKAGRKVNFEHNVVTADTVVVVARDRGEPFTRVIETSPNPRTDMDEIPPSDPMAQRLLGRTVGHSFQMDSAIGTQSATIEKIVSKYMHAYHRAERDFARKFPDSKIFGTLKFDENDVEGSFQPILESAQARAQQVKKIEEAYETGKAPIALLATAGGGTPFDFWDFLRHHPKIKINMALGIGVERHTAMRSVLNAPAMIIDPITLYGAQCLGFADILVQCCSELHITQSSIDLLHEACRERHGIFCDAEKRGSFAAHDDGVQLVEQFQEVSELLISNLEETLKLARTLKIAMPEEGISLHQDFEAVFGDVGPCFVDTLVVAKERGWTAIIDDNALRLFATMDGISSAWSQVILQLARNQGVITQENYSTAVEAMLSGNYRYVSIDEETIRFEWEHGELPDRLGQFLDQLALPTNDKWSVAQLIGPSLFQIWGTSGGEDRCVEYASFFYRELSARIGTTAAAKLLDDAVSAAVARAQRNRRKSALPALLKSSSSINSPAMLAVDINKQVVEIVQATIGNVVNLAVQNCDAQLNC